MEVHLRRVRPVASTACRGSAPNLFPIQSRRSQRRRRATSPARAACCGALPTLFAEAGDSFATRLPVYAIGECRTLPRRIIAMAKTTGLAASRAFESHFHWIFRRPAGAFDLDRGRIFSVPLRWQVLEIASYRYRASAARKILRQYQVFASVEKKFIAYIG